ncbi:ATP-dependent DNA ligase [Neolewinella lacunae]|uniref:DNA ligase (ATP) n=1 Tax=Neolewinella lacunae TaxID=1517758 RepID=A0A923PN37_9BACT|nr:ATP-dependent DNA ligase [Neolewinella lacunae]MBC6995751.1 ATP-dependent DNA ligase [Neolewinella lacunae]MDN3636556.1 ATP-dependent DNA ligase [Neolewinella lacunae]
MKHFAAMFRRLDRTTKTNEKVAALADYFVAVTEEQDKLWTIALLSHRRPRRTVNSRLLREWAADYAGIDPWILEESYHVVGDLAETIALVLPPPTEADDRSLSAWIRVVESLAEYDEAGKREAVLAAWQVLETTERYLFNKLITGNFRVGVSQKLMTRALSQATGIEETSLAHRLMGNWTPNDTTFQDLIHGASATDDISRPYPFYLAYQLEGPPDGLGNPADWQAEHKWDGIRGQLIVRDGSLFVWSRGEELVTDKYPEYAPLADLLPDGTVVDGEILPYAAGAPLGFNLLQTRIGRKTLSKKILQDVPVVLMAYDLLELAGQDIRQWPLARRREALEGLVQDAGAEHILRLSPTVAWEKWEDLAAERATARAQCSEGLMLKHRDSPYRQGRKKGDWWKWKVDPLTIDAVMIYAQRGHGRRANLYTDFTFGVWEGEQLVPFTKAYSGLTDQEFNRITNWVRRNTVERFGPVRSVKPELVFEIGFEGIQASGRHKSGVALRFPRMLRWREDKPASEANTKEDLLAILAAYGG